MKISQTDRPRKWFALILDYFLSSISRIHVKFDQICVVANFNKNEVDEIRLFGLSSCFCYTRSIYTSECIYFYELHAQHTFKQCVMVLVFYVN